MMIRKLQSGPFAERARRSAREIALACALTFAALVFVVAAVSRNASETASIPALPEHVQDHAPIEPLPVDGQARAPGEQHWQTTKDL